MGLVVLGFKMSQRAWGSWLHSLDPLLCDYDEMQHVKSRSLMFELPIVLYCFLDGSDEELNV